MQFVQKLFKNSAILICFLFLNLWVSTSYASTKILVWGDSLSAAYGIPVDKGWVSLLEEKLGNDYKVVNGSISGETSQGGLSRITTALKDHSPDLIILELGANDGLRGIPPSVTKRNLEQIIKQSKQADANVLLMGMKIPPNYGAAYTQKFEEQFSELAQQYQLPYLPFFLEKLTGNLHLFQADQLHPTVEAQPIILSTIMPVLKNALEATLDPEKTSQLPKNPG